MELKEVKGLGEIRLKALAEAGIFTCIDLLNHFPKMYYNFEDVEGFCADDRYKLLKVQLISKPKLIKGKANFSFVSCYAKDFISGEKLTLTWFGQTYISSILKGKDTLFVYGKNSPTKKSNFIVSMHKNLKDIKNNEKLLPVYKTFRNIGQATIKNSVKVILDNLKINSVISKEVEKNEGLLSLNEAYNMIHFPTNYNEISIAKTRISFEDAMIFAHVNFKRKIHSKIKRNFVFEKIGKTLSEFKETIPYKLTESQIKAIRDINNDVTGQYSCNRLLQGDTGSGKTLVALWTMFLCARNNLQSVLMTPTEILATQHFNLAKKLFAEYEIDMALISSALSTKEKNEVFSKVANGKILMIFGTQAVLNENLVIPNLQFIIADEQHRFGVEQRALLASKGKIIDFLTMSATPIPRSVNLVLYGGLDITRMVSRPHEFNIQTNIVTPLKFEPMWEFVRTEITNGRTCYVVCPKIDDDEEKDNLMSTTLMFKLLKEKLGKNIVAELNGKMKVDKKNEILQKFNCGEIKVLVSTTVVEVGVDSVNAGVIIIVNPERFGLATLHQLRGRVGRDGRKGYCFCMVNNNISPKSIERLIYFKNNSNGFDIADFDLKLRGAGDLYGTKQHGFSITSNNINLTEYDKARALYMKLKDDKNFYDNIDNIANIKYNELMKNIILN